MNRAIDFHHELDSLDWTNENAKEIVFRDIEKYVSQIILEKWYFSWLNTKVSYFLSDIDFSENISKFLYSKIDSELGVQEFHFTSEFFREMNLYLTFLDLKQAIKDEMQNIEGEQYIQYGKIIRMLNYKVFCTAIHEWEIKKLFKNDEKILSLLDELFIKRVVYLPPMIELKVSNHSVSQRVNSLLQTNNVVSLSDYQKK